MIVLFLNVYFQKIKFRFACCFEWTFYFCSQLYEYFQSHVCYNQGYHLYLSPKSYGCYRVTNLWMPPVSCILKTGLPNLWLLLFPYMLQTESLVCYLQSGLLIYEWFSHLFKPRLASLWLLPELCIHCEKHSMNIIYVCISL